MLEENHNLEKIIEDAKEYRWYSIPDMYEDYRPGKQKRYTDYHY